jgi:P27 family predicted phage terminase small subunit
VAAAAAGRKRTSHLKLVGATPGRTPGTDSGGRPIPETPRFERLAPAKPTDLSPVASAMWDAIVSELVTAQLLKPIDSYALQVGCETFARWHTAKTQRLKAGVLAKTSQGVGVSPLVRVETEASRDFRAWCAEFGLTPAAEVKLAARVESGEGGDLF